MSQRKLFLLAFAISFAFFWTALAYADSLVVASCGTVPLAYSVGATRLDTVDINGNKCTSGTGGGGGSVTQGTNPWVVSGQGTAGTAAAGVLTVQGIASMTPFLANPGTAANWGVQAQGSTTSGQSGNLVQGSVTTAAPTYVTGQTSPLNLDTAGNLRVRANLPTNDVLVGPTSFTMPGSLSVSTTGAGSVGVQLTGTFTGLTFVFEATEDSSNWFSVNGYTPSGVIVTGGTTTAAVGSWVIPASGFVQVRVRITAIASGTAVLTLNSSAASVQQPVGTQGTTTNITGWASGTLGAMANYGTSPGAVLVPGVNAFVTSSPGIVAQASTTSGQLGQLAQGAVTTAAPTYVTGQTSPLSLDTSGSLRVRSNLPTNDILAGPTAFTSPGNLSVSTTGSGSVGAQITGTFTGLTFVFEATEDSANWFTVNGYTPAGAIVTGGTTTAAVGDWVIPASGFVQVRLRISAIASGTATVTLNASAASVQQPVGTQGTTTNLASVNGITVLTGTGATGTGAQRVTVSTDQATNAGAALVKGGVGVVNGGSTYQAVAASQTATVLQTSTGAIGDYLSHCVLYPTSTSPGVVTVFDNTNAAAGSAVLFPGGASSLSNLAPIAIPVGAVSTAGAWKVTTGASISVVCYGKFS